MTPVNSVPEHNSLSVSLVPDSRRPRLPRFPRLCLLTVLLILLAGCGSGFTGGSIPIGRAVVSGQVVQAESPLTAVANSKITLTATPPVGAAQTMTAVADQDGNFSFPSVPTWKAAGTVALNVASPTTARVSQRLTLPVSAGQPTNVVVSLPSTTLNVSQSVSLSIAAVSAVAPDNTVGIDVQVVNTSGQKVDAAPTLIYQGSNGTIAGDSTFFAQSVGTGTVTAVWFNSQSSNSVTVTVSADAPPAPPPMPSLP